MRPVTFTCIIDVANKNDIKRRGAPVGILEIPNDKKIPDDELLAKFEEDHPYILGGLLDAAVYGLAHLSEVKLSHQSSMIQAERWITACEPALKLDSGSYSNTSKANRDAASELTLEDSLVANGIKKLMAMRNEWRGSLRELLDELTLAELMAGETEKTRRKEWPKSGRDLGSNLRDLAQPMREVWELEVRVNVSAKVDGKGTSATIISKSPKKSEATQATQATNNETSTDSENPVAFHDKKVASENGLEATEIPGYEHENDVVAPVAPVASMNLGVENENVFDDDDMPFPIDIDTNGAKPQRAFETDEEKFMGWLRDYEPMSAGTAIKHCGLPEEAALAIIASGIERGTVHKTEDNKIYVPEEK